MESSSAGHPAEDVIVDLHAPTDTAMPETITVTQTNAAMPDAFAPYIYIPRQSAKNASQKMKSLADDGQYSGSDSDNKNRRRVRRKAAPRDAVVNASPRAMAANVSANGAIVSEVIDGIDVNLKREGKPDPENSEINIIDDVIIGDNDDDFDDKNDVAAAQRVAAVLRRKSKNRKIINGGKPPAGEAPLTRSVDFDGWSDARVKAWRNRKRNANQYYYRFLDPGEKQKQGVWAPEEVELFMSRLREVGRCGDQWGVFSMGIPGRVGSLYRQLVKACVIKDDRYAIDERGALHYVVNGEFKRRGRKSEGVPLESKVLKKPRIARKTTEDEDEEKYEPGKHLCSRDLPDNLDSYVNPCPGMTDIITDEEISIPAVSPQGYVLDLSTWKRALAQTGRCPFTKIQLKLSDITVLTRDNARDFLSAERVQQLFPNTATIN